MDVGKSLWKSFDLILNTPSTNYNIQIKLSDYNITLHIKICAR